MSSRMTMQMGLNRRKGFWSKYPSLLPRVVQQGKCGSCAMISTVNCADIYHAIETDSNLQGFAFQDLVNKMPEVMPGACFAEVDVAGCKGSNFIGCFTYMKTYGVGLAALNPYKKCRTSNKTTPADSPRLHLEGFIIDEEQGDCTYKDGYFHHNMTDEDRCDILDERPLCGAFLCDDTLEDYSEDSGVYMGPTKVEPDTAGTKGRSYHAALVVDYGYTDDGQLFYWIQNSYGEGWGYNGYGMILASLFVQFSFPDSLYMRNG